jgi:uncharacterized protein (TIGR00106 family)
VGVKMIISQLSIVPIGKGVSVSKYVKEVIEVIKKHDVKSKTNAMATVIETKDLETLFNIVQEAHMTMVNSGAERVITELKIDDRRDKNATMESKIKALQ